MSFDGGFGAALFVRAKLVNEMVKAAHFRNGDAFRASVSKVLTVGGVEVTVSGALYVEAPVVTLRASDGAARVALRGRARLRVQADGVDESCLADLAAELLVPLALEEVQESSYTTKLYLDLAQFQAVSANVAIPWVSPAPGVHAPALALSQGLRQLLLDAIRPMARKFLRVNVPVEMLDQLQTNLSGQSVQNFVYLPRVRPAAIKVMDDAVAVGFDLFSGSDQLSAGDADALEQPWNAWAARCASQRTAVQNASGAANRYAVGADPNEIQALVAIAPAILLKYAAMNVKFQLKLRPMGPDQRVDDATLSLVPGAAELYVKVTLIRDDPFPDDHVEAKVPLVPMAGYVSMLPVDVVYHSGGIGGFLDLFGGFVTDYVRLLTKNKIGGYVREANWLFASAKYYGTVPEISGTPGQARFLVEPKDTAIDPAYVLAGIKAEVRTVHAQPVEFPNGGDGDVRDNPDVLPRHTLTAPTRTGGFYYHVPIRARDVRFEVADHPTLRRDPSIRTRWSVKIMRPDGSEGHITRDAWSDESSSRVLELDLWSDELYVAQALDVTLSHYRPPFQPGQELLVATAPLQVIDRFRRDLPYVRWHRWISWIAKVDGQDVPKSLPRLSAIHKTSIRDRCQFCDTGSNRPVGPDGMQHFATLPAAAQDGFRVELCQYCFPA